MHNKQGLAHTGAERLTWSIIVCLLLGTVVSARPVLAREAPAAALEQDPITWEQRREQVLLPQQSRRDFGQLSLWGSWQQGALLRGLVPAGTAVWLDDQAVQVSPQGYFAIGFGRDAQLTHELRWQLPDGQRHSQLITLQQRQYQIQRIDGLPKTMVTPPESVLSRIRRDNRDVATARQRRDGRLDFMQAFRWPAHGLLSGVYGSQRVLNGQPRRPHYGVDVVGAVGAPVYAPAAGVVTMAAADLYYSGGTMIIDHGHGITSTFLHLHRSLVAVGDTVEQGQLVAEIGATGRVTGAHLDWRMNWLGERVDPTLLVPAMPAEQQ